MRKRIESGRITECEHCGVKHPLYAMGTICFNAFLYISEKDLLELGKRFEGWRNLAKWLKFKDAKIDAPWTFPDEGRLIPYRKVTGEFLV